MDEFNANLLIFKCGYENMDFIKITGMLSKAAWSAGIKIDEVKKGASNSALIRGLQQVRI